MLLVPTVVLSLGLAQDSLTPPIISIPVRDTQVAVETLVAGDVRRIFIGQNWRAYVVGDDLYVDQAGRPPAPLRSRIALPDSINWLGQACGAGHHLVLVAGVYPEQQRHRDATAPRGAFAPGPRSTGLIQLDMRSGTFRFDRRFRFDSTVIDSEERYLFRMDHGETVFRDGVPVVLQACHWRAPHLYMAGYGIVATLRPGQGEIDVITLDVGLTLNRHSVFAEADSIWFAEDEGGLGGGCFVKQVRRVRHASLCALGFGTADLEPDAIVRFSGRLYASSAVGLIALGQSVVSDSLLRLSQYSESPGIHGAVVAGTRLWAVTDDGWVAITADRRAIRYRPVGTKSPYVHEVAADGPYLYIATNAGLLRHRM